MNTMIYVWVVIAFLGLIFEMGSPGLFYFLSFSFGGLLSAIIAFFFESIVVQGIVFLLGTCFALGVLKYWINARFYFEGKGDYKSNVYALKGKKGTVITAIESNKVGQVKISGEIWLAESIGGEAIKDGVVVKIVRVEGCRLIVTTKEIKNLKS